MTPESIATFLREETWQRVFDGSALAQGRALVAGKLVREVKGETIETGDIEITGSVTEKDGSSYQPVVILWEEGASLSLEGECSCGPNCSHAAALLFYLLKGKGGVL